MYKLGTGPFIILTTTGAIIPTDPSNKDYQEYLAWVAAGNTPEPCDECVPTPQAPSSAKILADALVLKGLITQAEIDAEAQENGVTFFQTS